MGRKKRLFWLTLGLQGGMALLSWVLLYWWETPLPVSLGTLPLLAMAGAMSSEAAFWGCLILSLAVYVLVVLMLWQAGKGKRYGSVTLLVLYILDLAVNVIFTAVSWWYLLGVGLDLLMMGLVLALALKKED